MAVVDLGLAFWHILAVVIAIAIKARREYAPKRLDAVDLVAQTKLVRQLVAYALRGTAVSKADVEDLAQDVIVEAWIASEKDRYRPDPDTPPERALHAWLFSFAAHHAWRFRDRSRMWREVLSGELPDAPDSRPGADVALEDGDERRAVHAALALLRPRERAMIASCDIDGEPMKAIADRLGVPLSTVYKWRARGLAALMKALRPEGG